MSNQSVLIIEYAKTTQNVALCVSISTIMILVFMMTPLNSFVLSSLFGKLAIIILLAYTIYYNVTKTYYFSNHFNVDMMSNTWDPIKTNVAYSYIFSGFLLVLMITVLQQFFK
jgi:hypothetical protein